MQHQRFGLETAFHQSRCFGQVVEIVVECNDGPAIGSVVCDLYRAEMGQSIFS